MRLLALSPLLAVVTAGCTHASTDAGAADTGMPLVVGDGDPDPAPPDDPEADAAWQAEWFTPDQVHEVAITLSDAAVRALSTDPYSYTAADAVFDGERVQRVGLRLRGKIGSFRTLSGKPKFKFDFGEYVDGQDVHGLKGMALNNEVVDCSYLKESIGYEAFRSAGIAAPRTGYAHVLVNGEDYGLYVTVEVPDGRFLADRFPDDADGALYDGKYVYHTDGSYTLLDFAIGVDDQFQLEEGEDDGNAHIVDMSGAVTSAVASGGFGAAMADRVDWDQVHRALAVEQWIGHIDGYAMNRNNYRVYFRPSDGRMILVPWDFDYAFLEDAAWGMSWHTPTGVIAGYCWQDPACLAEQAEGMRAVLASIDTDALLASFDAQQALIEGNAAADPRKECPRATIPREQQAVRDWIARRSDDMRAYWGL